MLGLQPPPAPRLIRLCRPGPRGAYSAPPVGARSSSPGTPSRLGPSDLGSPFCSPLEKNPAGAHGEWPALTEICILRLLLVSIIDNGVACNGVMTQRSVD